MSDDPQPNSSVDILLGLASLELLYSAWIQSYVSSRFFSVKPSNHSLQPSRLRTGSTPLHSMPYTFKLCNKALFSDFCSSVDHQLFISFFFRELLTVPKPLVPLYPKILLSRTNPFHYSSQVIQTSFIYHSYEIKVRGI